MNENIIINIDAAIPLSRFNIFQESIKMMLVTKMEAFEKNSLINKIFKTRKMTGFREEFRSQTSMGNFVPSEDMEIPKIDSFGEGYRKSFTTQIWTNSFIISLQTIEDGETFNINDAGFVRGYYRAREEYAYGMLAGALTGSYTDPNKGKVFDCTGQDTTDGTINGTTVAFFHDAHVPAGGVTDRSLAQSNKFITSSKVDSEEKMLEVLGALETSGARVTDDKGNIIGVEYNKIVISNNFKFRNLLETALKTKYTSRMGDNGVNILYGRYEIITVPYLHQYTGFADADQAMILVDDALNTEFMGAIWFERTPLTVDSYIDKKTKANIWDGRARFGAGFNNWRPFAYVNCGATVLDPSDYTEIVLDVDLD